MLVDSIGDIVFSKNWSERITLSERPGDCHFFPVEILLRSIMDCHCVNEAYLNIL